MAFYVYILHCADGSFYTGHTDDLEARLAAHRQRRYCGYTAKRLPVKLIFCDALPTRDEAFAAERRIKGWTRAKKLALAQGDWVGVSLLASRHTKPTSPRSSSAHGFEYLTMSGKGPPGATNARQPAEFPPRSS